MHSIFEGRSLWQIGIRIFMMQINIAVIIFLFSSLYSPLLIAADLIAIGFRIVKYCRLNIRQQLNRYHSITMDYNDNDNNNLKWKSSSITVIQWEIKKLIIIFIRTIIFAEEVQKYLSKLLFLALMVTIVASEITIICLEHLIALKQYITIRIFLSYFLFVDYIVIILLTYFVSKLNAEFNSIHFELEKIIIQMNNTLSTFRFKFQMACFYERTLLSQKPFGICIGSITVLKRSVFMQIIILYIRFTIFLLNKIYHQMSRLYLSSFSPKIHQSIFHYYTNFMLINDRWILFVIPIKERICWCLATYLVVYYLGTRYKVFDIDPETKYLFGDLSYLIIEDSLVASNSISLLAGFSSLMFLIIIYYSFQTMTSIGLRTFLLITQDDDPSIFQRIQQQNEQKISRATIMTLKFYDNNIRLNRRKFRSIFNRLFKLSNYMETKPIQNVIIHMISLQAAYIAFNFMLIYIYSPLMIAGYLLHFGFSFIRFTKFHLNKLMKNYSNIMNAIEEREMYSIRIKYNLIVHLSEYSRLILFTENVGIVLSKLFICALLVTFVASQIAMNCLNNLSPDSKVIMLFMYYFLVLDYTIIILLSYVVSKYNARLNSIQVDLNRIVRFVNEMSSKRLAFQIMYYYERLVNRKPFGIKIGVITVLTRAVFLKVSL
ncbi:hypothetical protein BLA29_002045 [Euroglyphus maynei]|uniref:Uncharacterized protein n=1 Tax=Euroglyphus maynei TaxID=6958 RepID=A0A1Y3BHM5_EURMA|nr:hypothetical protein BLA29_002045 [Euroglyphus maynei]